MNQTHPTPEEIVNYLHGELSPSRDAAIHAHIAGCAECTQARDDELSLTALLRAHAKAQERDLPQGVVASIRAAVAQRPPSLWERLSAAFRPAVAVPVAIAIAAFLYFGVRSMHGTARASTIDASYFIDCHAMQSAATPLSDDDPLPPALTSDDGSQ